MANDIHQPGSLQTKNWHTVKKLIADKAFNIKKIARKKLSILFYDITVAYYFKKLNYE